MPVGVRVTIAPQIGRATWPSAIDSERVKAVKVFGDEFPVIVSEFRDDAGRDYVSIVNNSGTAMGTALITWHGRPEVYQICWGGGEGKPRRYFDDDWPENPAMQNGAVLAPGQMELYRVESDRPISNNRPKAPERL